ncbi:cytochrome P450 [Nesidiocoris tenuis]|uniref:Cytochrome P450 n=1 Tax=Nesidiocoris tenuis TaxID=355587 RepID=A0ABN7ANN7_9HEMI|nr:cytochrome P450 [Nesidiocoris tenuis]
MNLTSSIWSSLFDVHRFRLFEATNCSLLDIGSVVVFVVLVLVSEYQWKKYRNDHNGGERLTERNVPGPIALPFIGTRWLYYFRYKINKVHEGYQDMFRRYGDIVKEEALWNIPVVSLKSREDIEKVLKYPSKYPMRPPTEVTAHYRASRPDRYANLGLVNEQGEEWHRLRTSLTPELTSGRTMNKIFPELTSIAVDFNDLIHHSRNLSTGVVHNFEELACRLGLESSCALILGERLGFLDDIIGPTAQKLADAVKEQFCASRDTFYSLPIWKFVSTSSYRQFVASEDTIYDVISEMVDKAEKLEEDTYSSDGTRGVFLSILKAPGVDVRDKKAAIIDFIAAGIKTMGNTLVFLLYLMAKNKKSQGKLYEEILRLSRNGEPLDSRSLAEAHYLRACIFESFRVLPTAPCVARILEADLNLSQYNLKAGTVVLCHTWLASLDDSNFPNAKTFMPERWIAEDGTCSSVNCHPFLVVPFGVGRRTCPGKRFVELELQVILAQIIQRFEVDFDGELELDFEFLLAPHAPSNFIMKDRLAV